MYFLPIVPHVMIVCPLPLLVVFQMITFM